MIPSDSDTSSSSKKPKRPKKSPLEKSMAHFDKRFGKLKRIDADKIAALGYKSNHPKTVYVGLDISTSCVGVTIESNGRVECTYFDVSKYGMFETKVAVVSELLQEAAIGIEQPFNCIIFYEEVAKSFAMGLSSADVLISLARMNGAIVSEACRIFGGFALPINVMTARAYFKIRAGEEGGIKLAARKWAASKLNMPEMAEEDNKSWEDAADSYIAYSYGKYLLQTYKEKYGESQ